MTYVMVPPFNFNKDMIVRVIAVMLVTTKLLKGVILAIWTPAAQQGFIDFGSMPNCSFLQLVV